MKYVKNPIVIDAIQFNGDNASEVSLWCSDHSKLDGEMIFSNRSIVIKTLEGDMIAVPGDWIICGVKGELYPCKPDVFEASYEIAKDTFGFDVAIRLLKLGRRVCRLGWNGKGMWVAMTPSSNIVIGIHAVTGAAKHMKESETWDEDSMKVIRVGAHIDMRAADGSLVIGWLASQTDMLAEDWMVLP